MTLVPSMPDQAQSAPHCLCQPPSWQLEQIVLTHLFLLEEVFTCLV